MSAIKRSLGNTGAAIRVIFSLTPLLAFVMSVLTLFGAAHPFVNYLITQRIIDAFVDRADTDALLLLAAGAITINVALLLLIHLFTRMREVAIARLELLFERRLGEVMLSLSYAELESPELHERKRQIDQAGLWMGGISKVAQMLENILRAVIGMVLAVLTVVQIFRMQVKGDTVSFWTSSWPLLILGGIVVVSILWIFFIQMRNNEKATVLNRQIFQANGGGILFAQLISDYHFGKDIRLYGLKGILLNKIDEIRSAPKGIQLLKKLGSVKGFAPSINAAINACIMVLVYLLAGIKAMYGEISAGSVVLYAGGISEFTRSVSELIVSFGELMACCSLLSPHLELLSMKAGVVPQEVAPPDKNVLTIEFEHVSFAYPNSDQLSLRDVNFTLVQGDHMAIVGRNGSGKTTIIKLLSRLYAPTQGRILLNGVDIQTLDAEEYRFLLAVVFQDFKLFSLPVGQNIAVSWHYAPTVVEDALYRAGMSEWLECSPHGLNTILYQEYDDEGVEISGGEAQKIAIARAIYRDSCVMILDEPTASLDPESEYEIYNSINRVTDGKTAIFISHRLSSCRFCNRILVMDEGGKVEEGTHEELLALPSGRYCELWHAQSQFYV